MGLLEIWIGMESGRGLWLGQGGLAGLTYSVGEFWLGRQVRSELLCLFAVLLTCFEASVEWERRKFWGSN